MSSSRRASPGNADEDTDQLPVLPEVTGTDDLEDTGTHIFRPPESGDAALAPSDPLERTTVFHPDQLAALRGEASESERLRKAMEETREALEEALEKLADREMAVARLEVALRDARKHAELQQAELASRDSAMTEARSNAERLEAERATLTAQLDEQSARIQALTSARQALESRLGAREAVRTTTEPQDTAASAGLAEALQDLRAYVDRRRDAWSAMQQQLALRDERLSELEAELDQRERQQIRDRRRLEKTEQALIGQHRPAPIDEPPPSTTESTTDRALVALLPNSRLRYPLPATGEVMIGRSSASDIQLRTQFVSRQHARLRTDPDGCTLEDMGSRNGVLVNGELVRSRRLQSGDEVVFGESRFRYEERDEDERFGRTLG